MPYVVSVDTHLGVHALAVIKASTGAVVVQGTVSADRRYARALRLAEQDVSAGRLWPSRAPATTTRTSS